MENSVDNDDDALKSDDRQNGTTADLEGSPIEDQGMEVVEESSQEAAEEDDSRENSNSGSGIKISSIASENTEAEESQDGLAILENDPISSQNNEDILEDASSKDPLPEDSSNGPVVDDSEAENSNSVSGIKISSIADASEIENVGGGGQNKHADDQDDVQMIEDSQDNSNNFNNMESSDTENAGSNGKQPNLENSEVS